MARKGSIDNGSPPPYTAPTVEPTASTSCRCSVCLRICPSATIRLGTTRFICASHHDSFHEDFNRWIREYPEYAGGSFVDSFRRVDSTFDLLDFRLNNYFAHLHGILDRVAVGGLWGEDSGEVEGDFDPDQEASADRTVSPFTEKDDDINDNARELPSSYHSVATSPLPDSSNLSPLHQQLTQATPPVSPHGSFSSDSHKATASDISIKSVSFGTPSSALSSGSSAYLDFWSSADLAEAIRLTDEAQAQYSTTYVGENRDVHMHGSSDEE